MSLTNEQLQAHLKDPAVFCCRTPKGTKISAENLEDPGLFPDDVDLGVGTRVSAVVDLVGALLGGLDGIGRERRRA